MWKLGLCVLLAACFTKRVETMSHPTTVRLRIASVCSASSGHGNNDAVLEQYVADAGGWREVAMTDATATVNVPAMHGGYSERAGRQFDESNPREYPVIRVRRADRVVRELSLNQIDALPRDSGGRAIVACNVTAPARS